MSIRILVISDDGVPSGYGRISMEVNRRLHQRGYEVMAASLMYDGLLPPMLDRDSGIMRAMPYWVAALQGKDWLQAVVGIIGAYQPDIVHVVQDAPYAEALRSAPVDWSRYAFVVTTPVDGAPVAPNWVRMLKGADATMSISQYGVDTHRKQGVPSELCRPGVDGNVFYPLPSDERLALRAKLGIAPEAFVLMTAATNQGRKAIPAMLQGFFKFAADKPDARYLMDMEPTGMFSGGWNILDLCEMNGWDAGKLIFRADAQRAGVEKLSERYNVANVHAVLSFREGYGLPLVEAMACGVVSCALDYCSGTEVCGGGKGILVAPHPYTHISTWGGAVDMLPNVDDFARQLQFLYESPDERRSLAKRGMDWARAQSWDAAADVVQGAYERVMESRKAQLVINGVPTLNQRPSGVDAGEAQTA